MIEQTTAIKINQALSRSRSDLMDATMLAVSADQTMVRRIGTSNEKMFPRNGGEGLNSADPWCQQIMVKKLPVLANDKAGLVHYLTEAAAIEAAGYGASGSFPIIIGGRVAGTINMLAPEVHFTKAALATVEFLLPIAALIFLFSGADVA